MITIFKNLRTDLRHIIDNVSRNENFRTTGDCSVHFSEE